MIRASLFASGATLFSGSEVALPIKLSAKFGGSESSLVQKLSVRSDHPLAVLYLLKLTNEPFGNFKLESESVRSSTFFSG